MRERIHKRLPVKFVEGVLGSFNQHRISEKEAMDLLGVKRSRLHQLRKRWLLRNRKKPFRLWQRVDNAFHVLTEEVRQWLDRELRYIRQEADLFRGKFNFAFLAEEAEKHFHRPFSRNSLRLYALRNGYYHAIPDEKGKVYTRFETSRGPGPCFNMTPPIISGFQRPGKSTTSSSPRMTILEGSLGRGSSKGRRPLSIFRWSERR